MCKKSKYIYFLFLIGYYLFFSIPLIQAQDPSGDVTQLMQQGRAVTCLKASWYGDAPDVHNNKNTTQIHLTGRCESPAGCDCMLYQYPNTSVALDIAGNLDELCNEEALGKTKEAIEERERELRNRCHRSKFESNSEVLRSVPVGPRKCNIVKNNIETTPSINTNSNVLGASTGLIPYGTVDIIVKEDTYKHSPTDFSAVGDLDPVVASAGLGGNEVSSGEDKTLKNGLLKFLKKETTTSVEDIQSNCTAITWDPYGRVFDAHSLEPISDVYLELIDDKTKLPADMRFNFNYDVTGDDGLFNIQVEKEGYYSLTVDPLTNHEFPSKPTLSQYWDNIYSDLYHRDGVFFEKQNVPTHHDIPLVSNGTPYRAAVAKIVPGTLKSQDYNGSILYTGRSTFPMAITCLVNESTGKQVGECVHANNIGNFVLVIKRSEIPAARLMVQVQKVDLNNPELYKKDTKVEIPQMNSMRLNSVQKPFYFEPILSLVEGYAYGIEKKAIPNAQINVRVKVNKMLYYQTKADSNGFFTIYSNNLPSLEYYLEIIDPKTGKISTQTTSEFATANTKYLESSETNLVLAQKGNRPIIKNQNIPSVPSDQFKETEKQEVQVSSSNIIEIIVICFALILLVIVAVVFVIKHKNTNVSFPQ